MPTDALVLVSWNGREPPLQSLLLDAPPQFELLLFDYSGKAEAPHAQVPFPFRFLSAATECKGDIFGAFAAHLASEPTLPRYVALIDDDVMLAVSDINRTLLIGAQRGLHAFSPALSHDSYFSHRWTLTLTRRAVREVDWVEVMMPFYDTRLFMAAAAHFGGFVSSWGFDCYLFPAVQKLTGLESAAILDLVIGTHQRPVSTVGKRFRNGMTSEEEADAVKALAIGLLREARPEVIGTPWYQRLFIEQFRPRRLGERLHDRVRRDARRWFER